jgi:phosphoribosylaminoimidazolecarboxamide formyltransferase/IMP cyclohydrolase
LFDETPVELTIEEKKSHMSELKGVVCSSDAFFPFPDNVHRARKSGVTYLAAPGGSIMDKECIKAADEMDMVFCHTTLRLVSYFYFMMGFQKLIIVVPPLEVT